MLHLNKIRELQLRMPPQAGRPPHLSAASGLVRTGSWLYVIADDELQLGVFRADGDAPGELRRLFAGELPDSKTGRKSLKPDLEALTLLPPFAGYPFGALLALGSGSKPRRRTGVLLALEASGALQGSPTLIDLSPLYASLSTRIGELNIEGAVVIADRLTLLQRGNKGRGKNALIGLSLPLALQALTSTGSLAGVLPISLREYDLGMIGAVPLCFSDGAALPNNDLIFTAIAEDTDNSYSDGGCVGAAVGIIRQDGQLTAMRALAHPHKIEGIEARVEGNLVHLLLVTDADDERIPAGLYSAVMEGYPLQ